MSNPSTIEPPSSGQPSLRKRSIEGVFWSFLSVGGGQGVRFISNVILTRLLIPEYFAIMQLVNTVYIGLALFSDVGIGPSIVRSSRGDEPAFLNTAWTFQVLRGLALWAGSAALAWPVAQIYEVPDLLFMLPVVGLSAVFDGFGSTSYPTLSRRINLRPVVLVEFAVQVVSVVVMVAWAWVAPSPWALLAGSLTGSLVKLVVGYRLPGAIRHRFMIEPEARRELFDFGRWVFVSTALTFLARQTDRLMLGKLFPLALFGVYGIAANIADIPKTLVNKVSGTVLFPALSGIKDRPRGELRRTLLRARRIPIYGASVAFAAGTSISDFIVRFIYEENYWDAAWMLPMILLGSAFVTMNKTASPVLLAIGKSSYGAAGAAGRFVYLAAGLPLGVHFAGPVAAIAILALAEVPSWIITHVGLARERLSVLAQDLVGLLCFVAVLAALLGLRLLLGLGLPFDGAP